ncbi:MAG: hypothetical protein OXD43_03905 [Bacteroidetes bacterium]|nr:hypothetical protein [Bacteroidota bacterium]
MDNPEAKSPNIDGLFFNVVSFELILMSLEQSMRLLLLLHFDIFRSDTAHAPNVLYKAILRESGGKSGIRKEIVDTANTLGSARGIRAMDEKEIQKCLQKHKLSYGNFRHFQLDRHGRLNLNLGFNSRELQVIHCLALAFIQLNMDEISRQNLHVFTSMTKIPESEMNDERRALLKRLAG